jgi:hypothetical protein
MAVLVPELKDSKKPIFSLSPEFDSMIIWLVNSAKGF